MANKILYLFYKLKDAYPFYVGIGSPNRPYHHFQACKLKKNLLLYNTLRKMLLANLMPRIKIVETGLTWLEACDLEKQFITFYGRIDKGTGCLCNHTDGGDGGYSGNILGHGGNKGREMSLEQRIKSSKPRSVKSCQNIKNGKQTQCGIAVASYNVLTNSIVKTYKCLSDVKSDGFRPSCVCAALKGRSQTSYGMVWRYI